MVDYKYAGLFMADNTVRTARIEYGGGEIRNEDLFQNSEELTEILCADAPLRFGSCVASSFKFKVANIVRPLLGDWLTLRMEPDGHADDPLTVGRYKVASDTLTADRRHREIVAYDAMQDILDADVAEWYNALLPTKESVVTMKAFRESFLRHFGLEWVLPEIGRDAGGNPILGLVNDDITIAKTVEPESYSGKDMIFMICEANGCFGHIGRDGKFHFIYLPQSIEGLYPSAELFPDHAPEWMAQARTGHLYPQASKGTGIGSGTYIECKHEDFRTKPITRIQIRQEDGDIGRIFPDREAMDDDNVYIIQGNILLFGKGHDELGVIAERILGKITDIVYRPFECEAVGNPCLEVGDPIRISTKYELIESYILERRMRGIQGLRDSMKADGAERYAEQVNSIHSSIVQLKGKTNKLTRTVDETKLEMRDLGEGLSNEISVTAGQLRTELQDVESQLTNSIIVTASGIRADLNDAKDSLSNSISVTASGIRADLNDAKESLSNSISVTASGIRADLADARSGLQTQISANAGNISAEVSRASAAEGNLSSRIGLTESSITAEVSRASAAEGNLSSRISVAEGNISLKVSKGDVVSEINASHDTIYIGTGELVINAGNFTLDAAGNMTAESAVLSDVDIYGGEIHLGNFDISNNVLTNGGTTIDFSGVETTVVECDRVECNSITVDTISADRDYVQIDSLYCGGELWYGGSEVLTVADFDPVKELGSSGSVLTWSKVKYGLNSDTCESISHLREWVVGSDGSGGLYNTVHNVIKPDISTMKSSMITKDNIGTYATSTNCPSIATIKGWVGGTSSEGLRGDVKTLQSDLTALAARVTALEKK